MSETNRPVDTPTFKEIVINSGSTPDKAKTATSTPIVIATRAKDAAAGAMASLILGVPDLDGAISSVKANGGTLMRSSSQVTRRVELCFRQGPGRQSDRIVVDAEIRRNQRATSST